MSPPDDGTWTTITSAHMDLAKEIAATLRAQIKEDDVLKVAVCVIAVVATWASKPENVVENAIATMTQFSPKLRGPLVKVVLDALAEQMEPSRV